MPDPTRFVSAEVSRRSALQMGLAGASALPLFWSDWLRAAPLPAARGGRAKSVILIFNCGGPSHLDLWDPKPDAPDTVRGPFKPIETNVPGIVLSELLPHVAQHADKLALVRTVHHGHTGGHNAAMHWSITGKPYRIDSTAISPSRTDFPSIGTLVGWLARRDGYARPLPPYVITPTTQNDTPKYVTPGQFGGCLGPKFDPFVVGKDPNAADFKVPGMGLAEGVNSDRLVHRRQLLAASATGARFRNDQIVRDFQVNQEKAFALMTSREAGNVFDLSRESPKTREKYGRHTWGQSHLLARRLVEAGVPFVTTVNGTPSPSYFGSIEWDTHKDNFNLLKTIWLRRWSEPSRRWSTIWPSGDCSTRRWWSGWATFGRSPIINGNAGRDHWPRCYPMVLAGGGIRGGQVVGQSDRLGASPLTRPVVPADIHATIFHALGYDPHAISYSSADGRPMALSEGQVISELL